MTAVYGNPYDLKTDPFGLSPDPRFSFRHPGYRRAQAYMRYALGRAEGIAVLTGAPGTGKTTLVNDVLAHTSDARIHVISPPGAGLSARDMRHVVATSLDVCSEQSNKAGLLLQIKDALIQRQRKRQRVVLMVDEAHDLSVRAVEELRLLADMQHRGRLMLQVFLVGQAPLIELIQAPRMEHLRQRIIAMAHLRPLSVEETADFIAYRLWRAGWRHGPAITAGAIESIHDFSAGIPRRVNLVSSRLLVLGAVENKRTLDRDDVDTLIAGLQEEMRFENPGVSPQSGNRHDLAGPKWAGGQQTDAQPLSSLLLDEAFEIPDAAASLARFDDDEGKRPTRELDISPPRSRLEWRKGVKSSISSQLADQPTTNGLVDTELTTVRPHWNNDPLGESASGSENNAVQAALKDLSACSGQTLHVLSGPRTKIGRNSGAENTVGPGITVKSLYVSRSHALIERRDRSYWITDLGSVNGTYVNDERVSGQRRLRDGDTIRIARYDFEFSRCSQLLRSA
jgi:type II secretory pathway predicted ATPase ExeA